MLLWFEDHQLVESIGKYQAVCQDQAIWHRGVPITIVEVETFNPVKECLDPEPIK